MDNVKVQYSTSETGFDHSVSPIAMSHQYSIQNRFFQSALKSGRRADALLSPHCNCRLVGM